MATPGDLQPHKITQPFQLLAAWFVMLIALEGAFGTAAVKIQNPGWIPEMFAIAMVAMPLLVISIVFLMQTKFRPHLQEGKFYFEWLKDSQQYTKIRVPALSEAIVDDVVGRGNIYHNIGLGRVGALRHTLASELPQIESESMEEILAPLNPEGATGIIVEVCNTSGATTVVARLKKAGFAARVYVKERSTWEKQESIWIGRGVSYENVVKVITIARELWPHLKYVAFQREGPSMPIGIEEEMFVGGSTASAIKLFKCKRWTEKDFERLNKVGSNVELDQLIKSKSSVPSKI
jgi:hypothetical protein